MPPFQLDAEKIALLAGAGFVAGAVDAIAGGGGLVTLPALLAAGFPAHLALGTNKGQSFVGTAAALIRFMRSGFVNLKRAPLLFLCGLGGALAGAALVLRLDPKVLRPVVLALLIAVAVFLALRRPQASPAPSKPLTGQPTLWAAVAAAAIAAYDGFFGPGTGTFLIIAFSGILHLSMARASAEAKVVNLASNLAALTLFALRGVVLWQVALPMAGAQLLGGTLGAHLAVRGGDRVVRWVVLGVVVCLVAKLGYDLSH